MPLTRRELMKVLLSGAVTGGFTHPVYAHFSDAGAMDRARQARKVEGQKPLFLSKGQFDALVVLAEATIPGSTHAKVAQFIDLLLSADTAENQSQFVKALTTLDAACQESRRKRLSTMVVADMDEYLAEVLQSEAMSDSFNHLKEWIAAAYYSSEEGMRELGWTGQHAFAAFPGCNHPDGSHE